MHPYEIRQQPDGSIDHKHYYGQPMFSLTPAARRFFRGTVALVAAGTITALVSAILITASVSTHQVYCIHCDAPTLADAWWRS